MNQTKKQQLIAAGFNPDLLPAHVPVALLASEFLGLVTDQECRLDNEQPISPIPLLWVALAASMGLQVDIATGRIVDGPRASVNVRPQL